jgi:ABC-type Fe3+-citrate transport system substrate-binding protein
MRQKVILMIGIMILMSAIVSGCNHSQIEEEVNLEEFEQQSGEMPED